MAETKQIAPSAASSSKAPAPELYISEKYDRLLDLSLRRAAYGLGFGGLAAVLLFRECRATCGLLSDRKSRYAAMMLEPPCKSKDRSTHRGVILAPALGSTCMTLHSVLGLHLHRGVTLQDSCDSAWCWYGPWIRLAAGVARGE